MVRCTWPWAVPMGVFELKNTERSKKQIVRGKLCFVNRNELASGLVATAEALSATPAERVTLQRNRD